MGYADGTLESTTLTLPPELFHRGSHLRDEQRGIAALDRLVGLLERRNHVMSDRLSGLSEHMESGGFTAGTAQTLVWLTACPVLPMFIRPVLLLAINPMILMGPECTEIIEEADVLEKSLEDAAHLDDKVKAAVEHYRPLWDVLASPAEEIRNSLPKAVGQCPCTPQPPSFAPPSVSLALSLAV